MDKKLTKSQQEVWDRLNYVPNPVLDAFGRTVIGGTVPIFPMTGSTFFNTTEAKMYVFDGTAWQALTQ